MKLSSVVIAAVISSSARAWTTVPSPLASNIRDSGLATPVSFLSSSIEDKITNEASSASTDTATTTTTTTTTPSIASSVDAGAVELLPEYESSYQAAAAKLSSQVPASYSHWTPSLLHFLREYYGANQVGYHATGNPVSLPDPSGARFLQGIALGLQYGVLTKYQFGSCHTALRGKEPDLEDGNTFDYYKYGCDFFRPCMNLGASKVEGMDYLHEAMANLAKGDNVIFFANHQSEADPQVMSCCMDLVGYGSEAERMVYVAGHKVTTDPLAVPFSMGRNLICIHSKKHIDADPVAKPLKQRQNLEAMSAMLNLFKKGGCLLWVAPSGGRDRRNVETGEVPIAPFDSKTIDMFRLMGNKSKKPTHYYPVAMVSYELCPPPDYVVAGVGEQRNVRFVPVGIAVGPELSSAGGLEARHEFCEAAFQRCQNDYQALRQSLNL